MTKDSILLVGDPSFRVPMAVVVMDGLMSSTVPSLLIVPVVYSLVGDLVARSKRIS